MTHPPAMNFKLCKSVERARRLLTGLKSSPQEAKNQVFGPVPLVWMFPYKINLTLLLSQDCGFFRNLSTLEIKVTTFVRKKE